MRKFAVMMLAVVLLCLPFASAEGEKYVKLGWDAIPEGFSERKLDDGALQELVWADPDTLRDSISTFADYVGWIDALGSRYVGFTTSNEFGQMTFGDGFSFPWAHDFIGANMIADMAMYILSDDYPEMQIAVALTYLNGEKCTNSANMFPVEDGYIVMNAASFAGSTYGACAIEPLFVQDTDALIEYCRGGDMPWCEGAQLAQVLFIDTVGRVVLDVEENLYVPQQAESVQMLYEEAVAARPAANSAPLLIEQGIAIDSEVPVVNDYLAADEIRAGTLDEAAARIYTVQDCMNYVYYSHYRCGDGDTALPARDGLMWHFNYKPEVIFSRHYGCCGATAGLVAKFLEGDYDEVGFVGITYAEGQGGGHVINYIKNGSTYYVFDIFAWGQAGYDFNALSVCGGTDLAAAARRWAEKCSSEVITMYAYTNSAGGDAPVGWKDSEWGMSYLIDGYAENIRILLDDPAAGHTCAFVEVDPRLVEGIELIRSVW